MTYVAIGYGTMESIKRAYMPIEMHKVGEGRNRIVYDYKPGWVIKFPKNENGELDNWRESRWNSKEIPIAKCYLEDIEGQCCLVMEKLKPAKGPFPSWVDFIDCQQVGINSNGELVAYDL